jgi:lipopolysaccharide export LptBFGC system permease protein LptF
MTGPRVFWVRPDGLRVVLNARRALRVRGVWHFYDVVEHIDVANTNNLLVPNLRTNVLELPEFTETPEQIKSEIKLSTSLNVGALKRTDIPVRDILNYMNLHATMPPGIRAWLFTKLHGRLASPFTCLVVVLIAVPFAAASGRRNVFVGVAGSICICFLYFILQQFGLAFGSSGHMPPWLAAWFPNIIFGVTGLWLMGRVR